MRTLLVLVLAASASGFSIGAMPRTATRGSVAMKTVSWCADTGIERVTPDHCSGPDGEVVAHANLRPRRYDSGIRLTPKGGSMDTKKVPEDEERWGDEPAPSSAKGGTAMDMSNPALVGGLAAVAAAAAYFFTQSPATPA